MKRLLLAALVTGSVVAPTVPAGAVVFEVVPQRAGINNALVGPIASITGAIRCTVGMHYTVRVQVTDAEGRTAEGRASGTCGDWVEPWSHWSTHGHMVSSDEDFECGTKGLARGIARTEDGHKLTFQRRIDIDCG